MMPSAQNIVVIMRPKNLNPEPLLALRSLKGEEGNPEPLNPKPTDIRQKGGQ